MRSCKVSFQATYKIAYSQGMSHMHHVTVRFTCTERHATMHFTCAARHATVHFTCTARHATVRLTYIARHATVHFTYFEFHTTVHFGEDACMRPLRLSHSVIRYSSLQFLLAGIFLRAHSRESVVLYERKLTVRSSFFAPSATFELLLVQKKNVNSPRKILLQYLTRSRYDMSPHDEESVPANLGSTVLPAQARYEGSSSLVLENSGSLSRPFFSMSARIKV